MSPDKPPVFSPLFGRLQHRWCPSVLHPRLGPSLSITNMRRSVASQLEMEMSQWGGRGGGGRGTLINIQGAAVD